MSVVRMGDMPLRWCRCCNLPVLSNMCSACGKETSAVEHTPPGDIRPAFKGDLELARELIKRQFGDNCVKRAMPDGCYVVINRCPGIDGFYEYIFLGEVQFSIRYDLGYGWRLLARPCMARRIANCVQKGWVEMDRGAIVPVVERGGGVLGPGVVDASPDISEQDEVIVFVNSREVVATGSAKMSGGKMLERAKGVAVRVRQCVPPAGITPIDVYPKKVTDGDVVRANRDAMDIKIQKGVAFLKKQREKSDLPLAVSYSGGKDSLASLLLVLEAGLDTAVFFIDTGLEFESTVDNVQEVVRRYNLHLITKKADSSFFDALERFGPPGRDFRWCCKTQKLGPASELIRTHYPKGVLAVIGQRQYESSARAAHGSSWTNPWIPQQVSISPIQSWTAMHVWLYIFEKKAPYNKLYDAGFDRIGCFLCPAAGMAELDKIDRLHADFGRWKEYLEKRRDGMGLSPEYTKYGLWRWRILPPSMKDYSKHFFAQGDAGAGIVSDVQSDSAQNKDGKSVKNVNDNEGPLRLVMAKGYSPCDGGGISAEGAFSKPLLKDKLQNLAPMLGLVWDEQINAFKSKYATVFPDGAISVKGNDERLLKKRSASLRELVIRSQECIGCGLCVSYCEQSAISMKNGVAVVDADKCDPVGVCLNKPCPATAYMDEELEM